MTDEKGITVRKIVTAGLALATLALSGCWAGGPLVGRATNEVFVTDGARVVVTQSFLTGGRRELGQPAPLNWQAIEFRMPSDGRTVRWEEPADGTRGRLHSLPLALDVVDGVPYLVSAPRYCDSYNLAGNPNPPYVVLRHGAEGWSRIPVEALPSQVMRANLLADPRNAVKQYGKQKFTAKEIDTMNRYIGNDLRTFARTPLSDDSSRMLARCEKRELYRGQLVPLGSEAHKRAVDAYIENEEKAKPKK